MKKNIIIYGYTVLGSKIASILNQKGYFITIVSFEEEEIKRATKDGFVVQESTLLNDDELIQIGVADGSVDSIFCVSDCNKKNLFVTLSARSLDKKLKIISVSKTKSEAKKLQIAGATKVLNPNELGALRIYRYMSKPLMLNVLDQILFSSLDLNISEIYVTKESKLNKIYFKDLTLHKKFNILILGIMDKELGENFIFNTKGINHKIDEGDVLVVLGKSADLKVYKEYLEGVTHDAV
ncbi:potassium channel family protein [Halarcobacter ebronensis]|uniref:Potassium transporter TrkA n=1 Tax=Halarcobacter ebronensis TaxID=1462615 RepID=A0A4Q1AHN4_9BACT|nr:NAD-binding protein [Halarcobacter ebronensis]QKF81159.1 TrkA domain-containing protein [Halarcobacter ebronensis]RXK03266.1 hypothetical protein CRV07_12810 [Halarcobacter ebronensis]